MAVNKDEKDESKTDKELLDNQGFDVDTLKFKSYKEKQQEELESISKYMWPGVRSKKFNDYYQYFMIPNTFYVVFFLLIRFAFENDKPPMWRIGMDFWLDIVYTIDMIRIFTSPYKDERGRWVYNRK